MKKINFITIITVWFFIGTTLFLGYQLNLTKNQLNLTKNKLNLANSSTLGGTKTITKIVYKNIVTQQSIKDKSDLKILKELNFKTEIMLSDLNPITNNIADYSETKRTQMGTQTDYQFDLWYINTCIEVLKQ